MLEMFVGMVIGHCQRLPIAAPQGIVCALLLLLVVYSIVTAVTADASVTLPVSEVFPRLIDCWLSATIWLGAAVSMSWAALIVSTIRLVSMPVIVVAFGVAVSLMRTVILAMP